MKSTQKTTIALSVALLASTTMGTAHATKVKGSQIKQGTINIQAPSSAMQSAGSPNFYKGEYLIAAWYGSVNYHKDDSRYHWLNVRGGAQPGDIWNRTFHPSFAHKAPGHNTNYIGGENTLDVEVREHGVFSTRFSTVNSIYWNIGAKGLKARVYGYEGCYEQEVKASLGRNGHHFADIFMSGNWCVGNAKISSKDAAILEQVKPNSLLYTYQGSNIPSTRWWPNPTQKKQFKTVLYPQIGARFGASFSIIGIQGGIMEPAIWFEYRNDGMWRVRAQVENYSASSDWQYVTNDRKSVGLNLN